MTLKKIWQTKKKTFITIETIKSRSPFYWVKTQLKLKTTVKPILTGHPQRMAGCLLNTG